MHYCHNRTYDYVTAQHMIAAMAMWEWPCENDLFYVYIDVRCALEDLYCSIGLSIRLWAFLPLIYMNYPGRYPAFAPLGFQPCSRRGVLPTIESQLLRVGEDFRTKKNIKAHLCIVHYISTLHMRDLRVTHKFFSIRNPSIYSSI